ncbi:MAG TPA: efflux RND transporter permease subunit [Thermoanaerobaculia bacterium]|nr:efflux RND transporter permease subunit [Thermoanaerobaculia bacterium]
MKLSEVSIRRPVLATVMSVTILLFGVISFLRTPVREYPNIDPPIVSITTVYRGAASNVIEAEITQLIEEELATLEGVKLLRSSSQEQVSRITVEFTLSRDVDQAANDVRDRIARLRGRLPRESEDPIVSKVDTNAEAVMWLALYGEGFDNLEVSDVANVVLKERLLRMEGVGSVIIGGERRYSMRIWLDPARLAAYGLTVVDVDRAIQGQNAEIPSGRIEGEGREFSVRTRGELADPEAFGAIFVAQVGDRSVHLSDVADVAVGAEDERTIIRYNGVPAVGLGIVKQATASTLEVANAVKASLPQLNTLVPKGLKLEVAYDSSTFIRDSIAEVRMTLLLALGLVVVVIFLFLKSPSATLIPTLAIPVSIVGAFTVVYFAGFTINILTLLALVLAIGLVVDDAIVMLENIYRHLEMGKSRMRAAFDGAKEIGFAIVATTIALVAIFIPVAFLTGNVGRLFNEFGMTVAVAVLISGFVALTLTPMLCSRMLRGHQTEGRLARTVQRGFDALDRLYDRSVRYALLRRKLVLVLTGVVIVAIFFLLRALPSELVPTEDRGTIVGIMIAPEGSTLQYVDRYARQIEEIYMAVPERAGLFTGIGLTGEGPGRVTDGFFFLPLKPFEERERSQQEIVRELFPRLLSVPGVLAFAINPPSLGGQFSATPVQYVIQAPTYDELRPAVEGMLAEAAKLPYLLNLDTDLKLNTPQIELAIDRARASALGVSVTDIGTTLQTLLGGRESTQFRRGDKQYKVLLQVRPSERATPQAISDLYLRGSGGLFQMANVVSARETVAPKELNHFNRVRSARITANLAPGVTLGTALDDLDAIARRTLPQGVRTDLDGESRELRESSGSLFFLFGISIVFIYLVLAAQFESFSHPLTILLTVPLAVFGALLVLKLLGMTLNVYSEIGLILLIGLVTKNAILIVEYANQLRRREGLDVREAVARAARIRLRPILMTSFATIFGVLPIALGIGAGAESRKPLGVAVVGGMLFSTLLALMVVPVVYTYLSGRVKEAEAAEEPAMEERAVAEA